jgi:thymidylate synthase (FAD)
MDDRIKAIKARFRAEVQKQGLNAPTLAKIAGLAPSSVAKYMSEYVNPGKLDIWLALSDALGYPDLSWLIANTKEDPPMQVTLINYTADPDNLCGQAAAMCYKGKDYQRALDSAMESGHESIAEHANFTFAIAGVSRVLLAQLTRHRHTSPSVQSQRYCGIQPALVIPPSIADREVLADDLHAAIEATNRLYQHAVAVGVPREDARYMTYQAGTTCLMLTANARELRHIFSLRCCNRAQWEIRQLADLMLKECKRVAPALFEDAGPGCVSGRCPEGKRSCGQPRRRSEWEVEEDDA